VSAVQHIAAKLVRVMEECGYIQKQGKNQHFGYKFAQAADVLEKINAALVKNGIATASAVELVDLRDVTTKSGTDRLAIVKVTITLIDSESGESLTLSGLGGGQDPGDKSVMKATTAALEYAWITGLQISTGDDPEADAGTDGRTTGAKAKSDKPAPVPPPAGPIQGNQLDAIKDEFARLCNKAGIQNDLARETVA
jgi:hypothetical protein